MGQEIEKRELSLIIQRGQERPRFFKIKNRDLSLFLMLPTMVALFSLTFAFWTLGMKKQKSTREIVKEVVITKNIVTTAPATSKDGEATAPTTPSGERMETNEEIDSLKTALDKKLESFRSVLTLFTGMQTDDKSWENQLTVDQITIESSDNGSTLKFNLVNKTPDNKRLAGYAFVITKDSNMLSFFPKAPELGSLKEAYYQGESFVTARFRPFEISFPLPLTKDASHLLVIFSKNGDFLYSTIFKGKS